MGETQTRPAELKLDRLSNQTGLPRRVLVMAALAILLIAALAFIVFQTATRYRNDERWTLHSYQVREKVLELVNHVHVAEMEARSYGLTGREVSFQLYWRAIGDVDSDTNALAGMIADNPAQIAAVRQLRGAIADRRAEYEKILSDYRTIGPAAAHAGVVALVSETQRPITTLTTGMLTREAELLQARETASKHTGRSVAIAAVVALAGSLALLLAAFATVGVEQHRRQRSERALEQRSSELQDALLDANRSSETLRRLSTLAELLQNCRDLDEAINVIERALPPLLPNASGALALINASRNIVEARMHWGERGSELGDAVFAPDDCWALRRSQPHPGNDDRTAPVCPHLTHAGVTADHTLCLPLNSQGQVLGVLSLCAHAAIQPETRRLAATAADQLALALGNLQLQATLRTQSIRDPLTNLFNRRYLEASLPRELLRAER
ncbi:MAG TPA: CHASE3 domain-containing protein, partial [Rhodanobacteraceae bacterium]